MSRSRALAPNMVGRQAQLRELESYFQLAQAGSGQIVFLAGDAGVGKTRLIREFASRARSSRRVAILEGRCYDEDPATPYGPFVDTIRAAVREYGSELVAQACDPWTDDLARLLPELQVVPQTARLSDDPQIEKRRLFEAIYSILRPNAPQTCQIVVLEDFHWSDQTSHELVRYLARAIARDRLLVLITYRTDELHRRHPLTHLIAELTRERLYYEIRLAPLSFAELASMLETTLERALPAGLVETLYDRTGGNPFFAEELLKSLIEHDQLDMLIRSAQQGRRIDQLAIPISIKDTILDRTADLDATTAEVLTYAAVIGRRFDFDLLLRLTGLAEVELVRSVERLVERQLVVEEAGGPDDRYSFRHALTREAVYGDLLGRERRMRHHEVLAALEEMYVGNRDEVIDQLAYHSLQSRQLNKAARYARLAGERAASTHAYREAVAHYETALDLFDTDDPRERAELFERLGHVAYPLRDFNRCARYWHEAQRLYEQLDDQRKNADLSRWLGRVAWERGDPQAAFTHTRAAIEILEAEPAGRELAMAYSALSQLYMVTSRTAESIEWGEKALRLADEFGDMGVKTHALNNIGVSLVERGEVQRGVACLERSLELAKQSGMAFDELRAYLNLGGMLPGLGEFKRAAELLQEGIERARQVHFELYTDNMQAILGYVEMHLGHWDQARALFEQGNRLDGPRQPHDDHCIPEMGALLLRQGRLDEARRLLESQLPDSENQKDTHKIHAVCSNLLWVYLALGRADQALALLDQTLDRSDAKPSMKTQDLLVAGIEVYLETERMDKAQELCAALAALAGRVASPFLQALVEDGQGLIAAHENRHIDADAHFQQAVERWHDMELPYEEARSRKRRAASLLQSGDHAARAEALRELAAARETFEALGAALELAAVDTILKRHAPPAVGRRNGLTRREREVIALIARGYSNRAIADALTISEKTAEIHVGNILGKLGFSSRAQAAVYAVEQGLADATASST